MLQNFITNFGYQLLYNSIIAMVIGIAILLFRVITCKKWEPRAKLMTWLIFIVVLIFPVTIPSPHSIYRWIDMRWIRPESKQYSNDVLSLMGEEDEAKVYDEMRGKIFENTNQNKNIISKCLFPILFIVGILKLLYAIAGQIYVWYEIRYCPKADERIYAIVEVCKKKLNIKRNIEVIEQDIVHEPAINGLFKVKLFMTPETLQLSDDELKCVIMHELSHYKRKDMVIHFVIVIADALYWFNPIDTILLQFMQLDLEAATDVLALKKIKKVKERDYNNLLLKVYEISRGNKIAILGFLGQKKKFSIGQKIKLRTRMQAINEKEFFEKHPIFMFVITLIIGIILLITLYPTSYGELEKPQLFLEWADGNKINLSENETIQAEANASFKLIAEGGNCKKIVMYEVYDLINQNRHFYCVNLGDELYLEQGKNQYEFIVECGNGTVVSYSVKIFLGY